ncbi:SigE family RNA polymerase sigma factor [Knoellia locipacati]|uniref:DNA-directed RNA polymerase sigma-70 factor n=1 Tax=Knoellia locipacati TaxID=882824 RepID=A0A512T3Z7_9MICO|nr:SigE family RNA polymerase sigma factor [Knoellia locipacati]GEQ14937.1 DNA-directed RNA polymerase sigma-70 factor [Knoellia locipacati]
MHRGPGEVDEEFADYVRSRQQRLLRAAYLVCGDEHLAHDLLQGALIKLALHWPKVRDEHPDAYVRRILYRDAVSAWRRRRREVVSPGDALAAVPAPERLEDRVDRVDLMRALAQLAPRQRAVIVLRYFEDRSEREIAEILGVSPGTVKSQAHDALRRLREIVPDLTLEAPGGVR